MPQVEQVDPNAVTQEEQPQAAPQDVEGLVVGVSDGLMQLRELMERTAGIMPEDKKRLDGIISEFRGLIQENLGASPDEQSAAPKGNTSASQLPMNAGTSEVRQAY